MHPNEIGLDLMTVIPEWKLKNFAPLTFKPSVDDATIPVAADRVAAPTVA
jgi:hypothetical protein